MHGQKKKWNIKLSLFPYLEKNKILKKPSCFVCMCVCVCVCVCDRERETERYMYVFVFPSIASFKHS